MVWSTLSNPTPVIDFLRWFHVDVTKYLQTNLRGKGLSRSQTIFLAGISNPKGASI